ncbi:hypothetical protein BDF14DRAFT_1884493 [Spinellus fusiger]|nr:hypothetical protein BDF14DRAFT_1884493 [Spinellus fusiger]
MTRTTHHLLDTLDVIFLGTIGVGTIAWFARKQISNKLFGIRSAVETKTEASKIPEKERNFVKIMREQNRRVIFFYGSQTGTAEDYASRLAKECSQRYGVSCMTADIELYDMSYLDTMDKDSLVVFLMATYGEGEPTDNAAEFWEFLNGDAPDFSQSSEEKPLENIRFMVFGLGNKTYEHYNSVGRAINRRMIELGATRVGEAGEGDDDGSLEDDFLAWQESMWPAFCEALDVDESSVPKGLRVPQYKVQELESSDTVYLGELTEVSEEKATIVYDAKRPYLATLTTRDLFSVPDRHCLHIEVDLGISNLSYQTGDHIAIWPMNNETQVNTLASVLGLGDSLDSIVSINAIDTTSSKPHPFPVPTTYRTIFRHYLDICTVPSRQTLAALAEFAPTEASKQCLETLSVDKSAYKLQVIDAVRSLGEVLELALASSEENRQIPVPFDLIVESLSRLQPRYYSISSSSKESPRTISVTAVRLDFQPTPERTVFGVNTNYLWNIHTTLHDIPTTARVYPEYALAGPKGTLMSDDKVARIPVHVRRSQFKLPRNTSIPIIMIGPGTGVAPFRAFVRERAAQKTEGKPVGDTWLFFGCRHPDQDFLYKEEWPGLFDTLGESSRIITAFSRETAEKVYVQHRLQEVGQEVWGMMEKGAYIYVCGDAKNMAKDVLQTFIGFAQSFGDRSEIKAQEYIKNLRSTGRYQEDIWS